VVKQRCLELMPAAAPAALAADQRKEDTILVVAGDISNVDDMMTIRQTVMDGACEPLFDPSEPSTENMFLLFVPSFLTPVPHSRFRLHTSLVRDRHRTHHLRPSIHSNVDVHSRDVRQRRQGWPPTRRRRGNQVFERQHHRRRSIHRDVCEFSVSSG
jgi:hypothetical protein